MLKAHLRLVLFYQYCIDQGGLAEGYSISESQVLVTGNPSPIPEFPSTVIPATMIIGFLGALLLIQRNEYALDKISQNTVKFLKKMGSIKSCLFIMFNRLLMRTHTCPSVCHRYKNNLLPPYGLSTLPGPSGDSDRHAAPSA
jgi:hypothetical protein